MIRMSEIANEILNGTLPWSKIPGLSRVELLIACDDRYCQKRIAKITLQVVNTLLLRAELDTINGVHGNDFIRDEIAKVGKEPLSLPLTPIEDRLTYTLLHLVHLANKPTGLDSVVYVLADLITVYPESLKVINDSFSRIRLDQVRPALTRLTYA